MSDIREAAQKLADLAGGDESSGKETKESTKDIESTKDKEPETTDQSLDNYEETTENETAPLEEGQREEGAEPEAEQETLEAGQIAELLGVEPENLDVDEDGKVRFKAKIDGEEANANLNDLLERYQRDANLTNRSKEVAEAKRQADQMVAQLSQMANEMAQHQSSILETLEKEYLSNFEGIDWKSLREDDPQEYTLRRNDFREAQSRFKELKQQAEEGIKEKYQKANESAQGRLKEYLQEQKSLIESKIPDWGPETQKNIRAYLQNEGFNDDEVNQVMDARMVKIAHDAMLYQQGKEGIQKKITKKIPKVVKPGTAPAKQQIAAKQVKEARQRLRESGSMEDAAALLRVTKE